jgi:HAD superfamily phosphatase
MAPSITWRRPDLHFPRPFDTIFFDVDGVLIRTTDSFRATDIAVAEYVTGTIHGLDWGQHEGKPLITLEDVNAFKQAGGYNNDWDMCYLLASLSTARLREWKGTPLAERSSYEWAALSRAANKEGHGGATWVNDVIPASARLDYGVIGDLYHEYYWGAEEYAKRFGHVPRYLPDAPGFVHRETMLFAPTFPVQLRHAGIRHLGLITGRVGPEVDSALERMEAYSGERWWDVVISADQSPKPDPQALRFAIEAVHAGGGLYIGDTADDHDLIINYRAVKQANEPDMLAVMIVRDDEIPVYQERGADFIVGSVEDVLGCLPDFEAIQETLEIMQDEELMAAFRQGVQEIVEGKGKKWEDVKKEHNWE